MDILALTVMPPRMLQDLTPTILNFWGRPSMRLVCRRFDAYYNQHLFEKNIVKHFKSIRGGCTMWCCFNYEIVYHYLWNSKQYATIVQMIRVTKIRPPSNILASLATMVIFNGLKHLSVYVYDSLLDILSTICTDRKCGWLIHSSMCNMVINSFVGRYTSLSGVTVPLKKIMLTRFLYICRMCMLSHGPSIMTSVRPHVRKYMRDDFDRMVKWCEKSDELGLATMRRAIFARP